MKNWFERYFGKNEKLRNPAFTADELERMAEVWAGYGHQNIQKLDDSLLVQISPTSQLQVHKHRVTFHGEKSHEAFAAAMQHVQHAWGGTFQARGSDEFKLKSWAYAQAYGLIMRGYTPPEHSADEAARLVAQIRVLRETEINAAKSKIDDPVGSPSEASTENDAEARRARPEDIQSGSFKQSKCDDVRSPLYRTAEYVPPRNAVVELFLAAPDELRGIMKEQMENVKKEIPTDDWPSAPYHYGMGRIKAYEDWLNSLSEVDRKREIAASHIRYEAHYQSQADLLVNKMRDLGHDLTPPRPPKDRTYGRSRGDSHENER